MRYHLVCILLPIAMVAHSQVGYLLPTSTSVAGISAARTDSWTAFHNPATLDQHGWGVAASYENRYLTAELSTAMVQASWCNRYVNIGVGYSFFGYDEFNEMMATLCLSRRFSRLTIGVAADLIAVYSGPTQGYRLTAVPQLGITIDVTKAWTLGIATFNPFIQTLLTDSRANTIPAIYTLASDLRFLGSLRWDVELSYDVSSSFRAATGIEWRALPQLGAKIGVKYQQYIIPSAGLDIYLSSLTISANAELHPILGVCLLARIGYHWD